MTECAHCHRPLREVEEIHAVLGELFCSKECAVEHLELEIRLRAHRFALRLCLDNAEIVGTDILKGEDNDH